MTAEELQAIRERAEKATAGPWIPYLNDGEKIVYDGSRFFPHGNLVLAVGGEVVKELSLPPEEDAILLSSDNELLPSGCAPIASHRWLPTKFDPTTGESPVPREYVPLRVADALFIAHAREDMPALLDEVEQLRKPPKEHTCQICGERYPGRFLFDVKSDDIPSGEKVTCLRCWGRLEEREVCAKVAEAHARNNGAGFPEEEHAAHVIATAIRARSG